MNTGHDDNKPFTAADIQRYLQGQMTPSQMHALEKAALEDPFLADAIEGYAERPWFNPDLEELRSRLQEKIEPSARKTGVVHRWWRVAAVVILLGGTGAIAYRLLSDASLQLKTSLSKDERSVMQDTISDPLVQSQSTNDTTAVALNERSHNKSPNPAGHSALLKQTPIRPAVPLSKQYDATPAPVSPADSDMQKTGADRSVATNSEKAGDVAYLPQNKKAFGAMSQSPVSREKTMKAEGMPAPLQEAAPEVGYPEYNKYVEKNKRLDVLKNPAHGDVVISFFVDIDGSLSDFKVERSLGTAFDNEAVRLIKEGPSWKVLTKKRARVEFIVKF